MLGYEDIQLLKLDAVRNLMAIACVAAQYLYHTIADLNWPEIKLLAKLGGWEPRKNRKLGMRIITWGLQKVLEKLVTEIIIENHVAKHGRIPPKIQALLNGEML